MSRPTSEPVTTPGPHPDPFTAADPGRRRRTGPARTAWAGLLALAVVASACGAGATGATTDDGADDDAVAAADDDTGDAMSGDDDAAATDNADDSPADATDDGDAATPAGSPSADLPDLGTPPGLVDLDGWLQNGDVEGLDDTRGRVTVVQFWTFGCFNCKNTLPNLKELRAAHPEEDVAFIGVHAPEFEYEADPDAIQQAADDLGVTWPIALDTDHGNFRAWQEGTGNFWPRTFVLDQAGEIRFDHIGEGGYDGLNDTVATLVADPVPSGA